MSMFEILDTARQAAAPRQPGASWQPDPTARHDHRWWDGERWTATVADAGHPSEDPVDLGQGAAAWQERWDNPTVRSRRDDALAARFGLTLPEFAAVAAEPGGLSDPAAVQKAIGLLRAPRDHLRGWARNEQAVLLNRRNAAAMARGEALALVHCARCGTVVDLHWDSGTQRYRCPARHKFMLDDVTLVDPQAADQGRATLVAQPPHRGVRL